MKDEPNQPLINSNVFASGCYEHANEYWFYLIDERQVLYVLNHEPRFLSITPDTGLIDLQMIPPSAAGDTTTTTSSSSSIQLPPALIESYQPLYTFLHHYLHQLQIQTPDRVIDPRYVAIPLVTAVYFHSSSHVPSPIVHTLADGTELTNYPDSLAKWARVRSSDRTALYDAGCTASSTTLLTSNITTTTTATTSTTCTEETRALALLAEQRFWHGVRIAIRQAELQRSLQQRSAWQNILPQPQTWWKNLRRALQQRFQSNERETTTESVSTFPSSGIPYFQCRRKTRFGAGPNTVRINTPFTLSQITKLLSEMDYTIDTTAVNQRIVKITVEETPVSSTNSKSLKSEL